VGEEEYYFLMNHTAETKSFSNMTLKPYESKVMEIPKKTPGTLESV
jgi:beta-galactosidase